MGIIKLKKIEEETSTVEGLEKSAVTEEIIPVENVAAEENDLPKDALFENKEKKTAYQNVFRFNDGTTRQIVSGAPKNYMDKKTNQHKKIKTCLCKNTEGDLECQTNIFETKFYAKAENGKIYSIKRNNCDVTLIAKDAEKSDVIIEQLGAETNNKAIVKDVKDGIDIEYEVEPNRIKENIIVKEPLENYIFDFDINLTNLDISISDDYKSLELKNKETGEIVFIIPSPVMYDANGDYSDEVSYEIQPNDETLAIKVIAEPEYFKAPERAFPVVIDPQVIVKADEITSYQVYRKMRGSSGYVYNWGITTSQYIKVSRDSSYDYKTVIKIDKSKIGLLDSTINSVKLRLRRYSISQYGNILVDGSLVYMGSSDIFVNITSTFKAYSDTAEFSITVEPYSAYVNGLFYAGGSYAPELEIEYLGNNDKPMLKVFTLAGVAEGTFNAGTGEMVTGFETISANDLSIGYGISHIYKQSDTDFGLGDNFRLNLHERFVKNYSNCDYTDPSGTKVAFSEYYYYLDDNNNKQLVSKGSVVAGIDGALTCVVGGKTYDVQAEYRSSTGLKVLPRLENVKNAELVEQRSEEVKQLESQVQSYKNVLDDYVLLDMNNKTITYDQPISEEKYNALKNPSYCCLVLSKAEALQYLNLCKQKENLYQPAANNIVKGKSNINANIVSLKSSLSQLLQKMNAYAIIRGVSGFTDNVDNLTIIAATSFSNINDNAQYICDDISKSSGHSYNDDESNDSSSQTTSESSTYVLGKDIKQMIYQRNLLVYQISEAQKNLTDQQGQVEKQIELIKDKRSLQIDQFNDYYKEYINLKFKFDQTIKHLPVNYLTDGTLYKGFNKFGDLVAIFDSYNNLLNIEYADSNDTTRRIKRVYDGEDKVIEFEYNSKGLLTCVTNPRGQTRKYTYNAPTKINGAIVEGESDRLGRIESSAGQTVDIRYTKDNTNGKYEIYEVASGDHLKTRVNYAAGKLSSVYDYSTASAIKHGEVTTSGDIQLGYHTVSYTEVTTTISNQDGNKAKYLFDDNEFVVGEIVEESGKVVSAKMYDYIPYSKNNIQYAKKDILNKYALSNFDFVAGDTESTVLNAFNNPVRSTTNARKLNADGTVMQMVTVDYTYNNDQKVTEEKTTIAVTGKENVYGYKKYYYNAQKLPVRTESFTEEKKQKSDGTYEYAVNAHGTDIEEVVYDEKGNVKKSFMYNSLDSSSKFYKESEYMENGQVKAEKDETGENKTEYEYIDGTNLVRTETLPNRSKFSYGHDKADRVTGITQSTEEGEENSNSTSYTYGEVTEVRSGNNVVQYAYEAKRHMSSVNLNETANYVKYSYAEKTTDTVNGVSKTVNKVTATYAPREGSTSEVFVTSKDLRGNLLKTSYNGSAQTEYTYTADDKLESIIDRGSGRKTTYTYDALDRVTKKSETKVSDGVQVYQEVYTYGKDGTLTSKTISGTVTQTYAYTYKNNSTQTLDYFTVGSLKVSPQTDCLGRNTGKEIALSGTKLYEEIIAYRKIGDHATNMPSTIRYGDKTGGTYGIRESLKYAYDEMGNIAKVYENGELSVRYTYDKLGRLIREDNKAIGETYLFDYDNQGNILTKRTLSFTLKGKEEAEELLSTVKEYTYEGDRLLSYSGETFAYDGLGNPKTYRGKPLTWSKGRQLTNYNGITFGYDGRGRRTSKGNIGYTYGSDGQLLKQSDGWEFLYDNSGVMGFIYGNNTDDNRYLYRKDILGNITGILDKNGKIIVKYKYDAWGNYAAVSLNLKDGKEKFCDITDETISFTGKYATYKTLAEKNPFRYRSYYYDTETELYYLHTRYYDPEVGRFITIDDLSYLDPDTINGLNLYAYCCNNPVMNVDPNGTKWWNPATWNWKAIGRFVGGSLLTIGGAIGTVITAPLALVPGLSIIPQATFSLTLYGGFVAASAFSNGIYKDMSAIGWNPFNSNESAVIAANQVSFYKGIPVFRHSIPGFISASAFGMIFLNRNDMRIDTIRHEWGAYCASNFIGASRIFKMDRHSFFNYEFCIKI